MLLLLAAPLRADGPAAETPNWLAEAKSALELGSDNAASLAAKALKAKPLGAAENRQMALTLFWTGHFEDSARYLRRALSSERDALLDQPTLPKLMPAEDARERLVGPHLGQRLRRVDRALRRAPPPPHPGPS